MRLLEKIAKAEKAKEEGAATGLQNAALVGTGAGVGLGVGALRSPTLRRGVRTFADLAPDVANLARANKLEEFAIRRTLQKLDKKPGGAMATLRRLRGRV